MRYGSYQCVKESAGNYEEEDTCEPSGDTSIALSNTEKSMAVPQNTNKHTMSEYLHKGLKSVCQSVMCAPMLTLHYSQCAYAYTHRNQWTVSLSLSTLLFETGFPTEPVAC